MPSVYDALTGHKFETHENCRRTNCHICDGGLSLCVVCHGAEGSLTTHCPGEQLSADTLDDVYCGRRDYKSGKWVHNGG